MSGCLTVSSAASGELAAAAGVGADGGVGAAVVVGRAAAVAGDAVPPHRPVADVPALEQQPPRPFRLHHQLLRRLLDVHRPAALGAGERLHRRLHEARPLVDDVQVGDVEGECRRSVGLNEEEEEEEVEPALIHRWRHFDVGSDVMS
ncbi:unnamed protein product [Cuscuta campestris]|uniref:Uncharacterized protein n=1 Tax=Cuscuta campestris TaxID=132261 RepID=A0A484K7P4_9ASTE|nr:unnamed protein product [Cuscuta campestris]